MGTCVPWGEGPAAVRAFLAGKAVLLTGGSGFLGRVLLERLLRAAPDGGDVFLLVRSRRGVDPQQRLLNFTNVSLFDGVRPALARVKAVAGDCALPGLGLSPEDRAMLTARVAVVFHCAASVRFDLPLRSALLLNVRATRDLCDLAADMPLLQAFVHVSTAYSNCNRCDIDEVLYPAPGDWRTYLRYAEDSSIDDFAFDVITSKILGNLPNTYTFTKALAEHVVNDYCHRLPVGIIRPSIVCPTDQDPFPGWIDNFNGPTAILFPIMLGALHVSFYDVSKYLDVIPADYVISGIVLTAVHLGTNRKLNCLQVFNATCTNRYLADMRKMQKNVWDFRTENKVPCVYITYSYLVKSELLFRLLFLILDLPIALILDCIAWIIKQKRRIVKIYQRVIVGQVKLAFFCVHSYVFTNNNFLSLRYLLDPNEKESYILSTEFIHVQPIIHINIAEIRKLFFAKYTIQLPGRQEVILVILHLLICGILLLTLWNSDLMSLLTTCFVRLARFILAV